MTIVTYSSSYDSTTQARFQAWGLELSTNLQAAGLVKTVDTGQINWSTVALPAAQVSAGYEIYTLPGGALYFKLEYGIVNYNATNMAAMWLTVGTGSDGAGNITGATSNRNSVYYSTGAINTLGVAYPTYICVTPDFFGLVFKYNSTEQSAGNAAIPITFMVGRTVDGSGIATGIGYYILYRTGSFGSAWLMDTVRIAATQRKVQIASGAFCMPPGNLISSQLDNGNLQAYQCWASLPEGLPCLHVAVVTKAEVPFGNTFSVAMAGPTKHTLMAVYDSLTSNPINCTVGVTGVNFGLAMLWE